MTTKTSLLFASASLLFIACTGGAVDTDAERGPLGKADNVGTCEADTCGGPSADGTCWCDDKCDFFGDCCANKADTCDAPAEPKVCGGFAGFVCDDGEYCEYDQDEMCGAADQLGECKPLPEVCIEVLAPVCGCDGNTYDNFCFAHAAGTSVLHDGACEQPAEDQCGGFAGFVCGDGEYCHYEQTEMCGAADQMGTCKTTPEVCIELFAPVCGCDGNTYSNSCFANGAGTSVSHDGPCQ